MARISVTTSVARWFLTALVVGACSSEMPVPTEAAPSTEPVLPTASAPPTRSPASSSTPVATPVLESPFVPIGELPGQGETVTDLITTDDGFVAVGYASSPNDDCDLVESGRLWRSDNGVDWEAEPVGLVGMRPEKVLNFRDALYVFGEGGEYCGRDEDIRTNVWRRDSDGKWDAVGSEIDLFGRWSNVLVVDDQILAFLVDYKAERHLWRSSNGRDWVSIRDAPVVFAAAADGDTVVAFGYEASIAGLRAWYSADAGLTWSEGTVATDYDAYPRLFSLDGRFIAPSSACCGVPETRVGVALESTDGGRTWRPQPSVQRDPADGAVAIDDLLLALSEDGSTSLSRDGRSWFSGPPGPPDKPRYRSFGPTVASAAGAVVITDDWDGAGLRLQHAWFAPAATFDPASWESSAPLGEVPENGRPYELTISTHCGTSSMVVNMGGKAWGPTGNLPTNLDYNAERGTFILLNDSRATFTTSNGATITYVPIHPAPPPFICY